MEKPMTTPKIPPTDSLTELARFWDTHDLTDFEDQLEEVREPVFERRTEQTVRKGMPRTGTILRVFVASPGDVAEEREVLESIIGELNLTWSKNLGIYLELVKYET